MSRDVNGTYTLPLADVVSGTVITSAWGNTTIDDVKVALTDSFSKSGKGAMTAGLKGYPGTKNLPGYTFSNEISSGLYRAGAGDVRLSVLGVDYIRWYDNKVYVWDNVNSIWVDIAISSAQEVAATVAELVSLSPYGGDVM